MFRKYLFGSSSPNPFSPPGNSPNGGGNNVDSSLREVLSTSQSPDKSGFPFMRGAAAVRFGLPSLVRGACRSFWSSHCALALASVKLNAISSPRLRLPKIPVLDRLGVYIL